MKVDEVKANLESLDYVYNEIKENDFDNKLKPELNKLFDEYQQFTAFATAVFHFHRIWVHELSNRKANFKVNCFL